jgi:hypothetical protein
MVSNWVVGGAGNVTAESLCAETISAFGQGAGDCRNVARETCMQAFHLDHEPEKFMVWPETDD